MEDLNNYTVFQLIIFTCISLSANVFRDQINKFRKKTDTVAQYAAQTCHATSESCLYAHNELIRFIRTTQVIFSLILRYWPRAEPITRAVPPVTPALPGWTRCHSTPVLTATSTARLATTTTLEATTAAHIPALMSRVSSTQGLFLTQMQAQAIPTYLNPIHITAFSTCIGGRQLHFRLEI